ncbi:MAG: hypothetical protein M1837_001272 [Sclerophora amabilis]|nr:MAG: hypothetical protein M1837_001272 [Sclerophora amabilis]
MGLPNSRAEHVSIETPRGSAIGPTGQTRLELGPQQLYPTAKDLDAMPINQLRQFIVLCEERDQTQMSLPLYVAYDTAKDILTRRQGPQGTVFPMQHTQSTGPAGDRLESDAITTAMRQQLATAESHYRQIQRQGPTRMDDQTPAAALSAGEAPDNPNLDLVGDTEIALAVIRHLGRIGGLATLNKYLPDHVVLKRESIEQPSMPIGTSLADAPRTTDGQLWPEDSVSPLPE